jgi:glycosyltransferase involved in cell wall biosynthesis
MNILMIAINDPAGTAIAFTKAINRYTEHTCRLITKEIRYNFMYDKDLHLPWLDDNGWCEVEHLLKDSDVYHFHMLADENLELGPLSIGDYIKGKQIVHHHHGHADFRSNPEKYRHKYKDLGRGNLLVSTPDLLMFLPEAKWQPNLVPIDDALYRPVDLDDTGPLRICQAPTRKDLKNTDDFIRVTQELRERYTALEPVCIEGKKHTQCLGIKQSCHIRFEKMQGYFGVSSLESLSQGKPVIAGLDDWNIQYIKEFTGADELPWVIARNADELKKELIELIADRALRSAIKKKARLFIEKNWSERQALTVLMDVYRGL